MAAGASGSRVPAHLRSFGKYTLLTRLATGGMAEIFVARQKGVAGFEKQVVIKRILPHLADEEGFVQMFLDEARIAARISHPNVCQVYELGEVDGQYFIAMEYLEGVSLMVLLKKLTRLQQRLDPALVAGMIAQACEGLHHAHELTETDGSAVGVVHRDVSPQNLFLTAEGAVKVLDFGIAKAQGASAKTRTGTVKGKYAYMSPEQLRGESLDRRSDVFALGIVTYEALTVKRLFYRETDFLIFKAIAEEEIPQVRGVRPDVPADLNDVVSRALSRSKEGRYVSARSYGDAVLRSVDRIGGALTSAKIGEMVRKLMAEEMAAERELIMAAAAVPDDKTPPPSRVVERAGGEEALRPAKLPLPAPPLTPPPVRLAEVSLRLARPDPAGSGLRRGRRRVDAAEDTAEGPPPGTTADPTAPMGAKALVDDAVDTAVGADQTPSTGEATPLRDQTPSTGEATPVHEPDRAGVAARAVRVDVDLLDIDDDDDDEMAKATRRVKLKDALGAAYVEPAPEPGTGELAVGEPSDVEVDLAPRRRGWLYVLLGGVALAAAAGAAWALWPRDHEPARPGAGAARATKRPVVTPLAVTAPSGGSGGASVPPSPGPMVSPSAASPEPDPEPQPEPQPEPVPVLVPDTSPSASASAPPSPSPSASPSPSRSPSPSPSAVRRKPDKPDRPDRPDRPDKPEPSDKPAASGPPGTFSIDSDPYATIYIDGRKVGDTPLYKIAVTPGKHKVRAVSASGTQSFSIDVAPGQAVPARKLRWSDDPK